MNWKLIVFTDGMNSILVVILDDPRADAQAMGKFIDEDLGYMQMLTNSGAVLEEKWRDFNVRGGKLKKAQGKSELPL